jgi:hypothetical protein
MKSLKLFLKNITAVILILSFSYCLDNIGDTLDKKGVCLHSKYSYKNTMVCDDNISYYACDEALEGQFYTDRTCADLDYTYLCPAGSPYGLKNKYIKEEMAMFCQTGVCLYNNNIYIEISGVKNYIPICRPNRTMLVCDVPESLTFIPDSSCPENNFTAKCNSGSYAGYYVMDSFFSMSNADEFCVR